MCGTIQRLSVSDWHWQAMDRSGLLCREPKQAWVQSLLWQSHLQNRAWQSVLMDTYSWSAWWAVGTQPTVGKACAAGQSLAFLRMNWSCRWRSACACWRQSRGFLVVRRSLCSRPALKLAFQRVAKARCRVLQRSLFRQHWMPDRLRLRWFRTHRVGQRAHWRWSGSL